MNGQGFERVVGYYESWSPDRPCNQFYPEQIPKFIYTHLNFAFATIDPVSFEVKLASSSDEDLVRRLTGLKAADPGLSVFVALGGWTFNDPGPTATTFGDIARSEANTKKFTNSLISFMSTYNFDGVDLDWEYPEATDRSGQSDDYANLSTFLQRVKNALRATGGRSGLSITLPASFCEFETTHHKGTSSYSRQGIYSISISKKFKTLSISSICKFLVYCQKSNLSTLLKRTTPEDHMLMIISLQYDL